MHPSNGCSSKSVGIENSHWSGLGFRVCPENKWITKKRVKQNSTVKRTKEIDQASSNINEESDPRMICNFRFDHPNFRVNPIRERISAEKIAQRQRELDIYIEDEEDICQGLTDISTMIHGVAKTKATSKRDNNIKIQTANLLLLNLLDRAKLLPISDFLNVIEEPIRELIQPIDTSMIANNTILLLAKELSLKNDINERTDSLLKIRNVFRSLSNK